MRVLVTASSRFAITPDGTFWTANPSVQYHFWTRYLDVYDEVLLLARARPVPMPLDGWLAASGPGIQSCPLPYFVGPGQFIRAYPSMRRAIAQALNRIEAVQLRLPCAIGGEVHRQLSARRPYGVEVISDPYDTFSPGSVRHPFRPFFRWWFTHTLQRQCAQACAAAYVTEHALQHRYPPAQGALTTHFSSIQLSGSAIADAPRTRVTESPPYSLVYVGTLEQLYKAPDVLIQAVSLCHAQNVPVNLTIIGDGQHRTQLEHQATELGLGHHVQFTGHLSTAAAIQAQLDQADLFVLPSRQEGLPRAMIEAMARGLPCIGSTVGGFAELLPVEDLVPPGDAIALATKIMDFLSHPQRRRHRSARNLEKAREYQNEILCERRRLFYHYVSEKTEEWLKEQQRIQSIPSKGTKDRGLKFGNS